MKLAVVIFLTVFLAGCTSGAFLGNPSKVHKYEQPDLRQDEAWNIPLRAGAPNEIQCESDP